MLQARHTVEIKVSATQRRELAAKLCLALNQALSRQDHWESGCELCHWHATADSFDLLPAAIIESVFNEWSDTDERLDEIEFSGYLDTNDGHRAWGFLAMRKGEPRLEERPTLEKTQMTEQDGVYQLKATILRSIPGEAIAGNA